MTLKISDLQSDSDLDSIRNSCDVYVVGKRLKELHLKQKQIRKRTLGIANARQFWYQHAKKHLKSSLQSIFVILR